MVLLYHINPCLSTTEAFNEIRKMPLDAQGKELLVNFAADLKQKIDQQLLE
jgi:hypothetical protein